MIYDGLTPLEVAEFMRAKAERELRDLREAARELLRWGVELDDLRMSYIVAQVDRAALDDLRALLPAEPAADVEVSRG